MAGKINKKLIEKKIFSDKSVQRMVHQTIQKEVQKEKILFQTEFELHPVTQELDGGENSSNISGTLGGYGNLFSFLGFGKGVNPTNNVKLLIRKINLDRNISSKANKFQLKIDIPSKEEFATATRLPWESGSWLFDIERGISGLGSYLYGRFSSSRSGAGIQSKFNYSNRIFRPIKYFSPIYTKFLKRLGVI
jgi:hypothetical protein